MNAAQTHPYHHLTALLKRVAPLSALLLGALTLSLMTQGCERAQSDAEQTSQLETKTEVPTLSVVTAERQDLLFLYKDKDGVEQRAITLEEIPEGHRTSVQVVDLARSPAQRAASEFVQLFDLRKADERGQYPGRLVKRDQLESKLAEQQALPEQPPIVIYSTSWCGVCKKAMRFMKSKGWLFVNRDVEESKEAAKELQQKAARAQLQLGGVPVIDVGGRLLSGFDPQALTRLVEAQMKAPASPASSKSPSKTTPPLKQASPSQAPSAL
jgi:glutaredoxin